MPQKNIAVIVAHPDDEVLAFGGSICRHGDAGHNVDILFLATGLASRETDKKAGKSALAKLRRAAEVAGSVMGARGIEFADFPDNAMDSVPLLDIVQRIEAFLGASDPDIVYCHHGGDLNIDHKTAARAVLTACRPLPGVKPRALYAGEVLSATEYAAPEQRFQPTVYVSIEDVLERKCQALACYGDELRAFPHPRSVEAVRHLAGLRGTECGLSAAETLRLIRDVRH
jgi:N-acetylglucosamine malate deacetylase 1